MKRITTILLILILTSILSYGQRLRPIVVVGHVAVTKSPEIPSKTEKITLILSYDSIRIVTSIDTLSLTRWKPLWQHNVYSTKDGQLYHLTKVLGDSGILLILSPLKPYKQEHLYSIKISTCEH